MLTFDGVHQFSTPPTLQAAALTTIWFHYLDGFTWQIYTGELGEVEVICIQYNTGQYMPYINLNAVFHPSGAHLTVVWHDKGENLSFVSCRPNYATSKMT